MGDNNNYYIGIYSVNQTDDVTQFITCSLPWFEQKLPYREEYAFENTRDVGAKSQRWQEWYQMKPFDHFYRFVFFCWHFPPQPAPPPLPYDYMLETLYQVIPPFPEKYAPASLKIKIGILTTGVKFISE